MLLSTIRGRRGSQGRVVGALTAGGPHAAPASAASRTSAAVAPPVTSRTLVAAVALAGCGPWPDPETPTTTPSAGDTGPLTRAAVPVAPGLDGATAVNAVNDAGDMVVSRAGPVGMEFYYLADGAQP